MIIVTDDVHLRVALAHSQAFQDADDQRMLNVQYWTQPMKILSNRIILGKHQIWSTSETNA